MAGHVSRLPNGGFALIITLALLAFLLLVMLGLATFTKVETNVADNALKQTLAKQNALMALNIALAQLQKHAGPDTRVTATSEFVPSATQLHYTGVWNTANAASPTPVTWLVSGNEGANPLAVTPLNAANTALLVGPGTVGATKLTDQVSAPLVDIKSDTVPGQPAGTTIGRYAWWVGDQGVKASLAQIDRSDDVNYAPFQNSAELRRRIRQQATLGANPPEIDPRDSAGNAKRVGGVIGTAPTERIESEGQLALLDGTSGAKLGSTVLQTRFHDWSARNFAVLGNTVTGGLRQDLSLKPDLLGNAFAKWANYPAYMENPASVGAASAPVPAYGSDPLRRRYRISPQNKDKDIIHSVAPALSLFIIQFNIRRTGGNSAPSTTASLEVRARMVAECWNPFTSGLVPENLLLEVSGLPAVLASDSNGGSNSIDLQGLYGPGDGMAVNLTKLNPGFDDTSDVRTWLPGRTYYWRTAGGAVGNWLTEIYNRTISVSNANLWIVPTGKSMLTPPALKNASTLALLGPPTRLTLKLRRASDRALLATYLSPLFDAVNVPAQAVGTNDEFRFGYAFRVSESVDTAAAPETWLVTDGRDPRSIAPVAAYYRTFESPNPNNYVGVTPPTKIAKAQLLLDRVMGATGKSYNEDVPLFELPRSPVLSMGMLQHIQVTGRRPFTIGNSWGKVGAWNSLFDRYFFSGLATGVGSPDFATGGVLPNTLLAPLHAKPDGTPVAASDLTAQVAAGYSSKYLLQAAAFNLNSMSATAWLAILRSLRYSTGTTLSYLNAEAATGTGADTSPIPLSPAPPEAVFYRYSQSAQETFKAETNYVQSTGDGTTNIINAPLFRRGMRSLSSAEGTRLASAIAANVQARVAASGPFRSMADFLDADPKFTDPSGTAISLLEKSIADAALNSAIAEFSAQWLLQGDIMTSLAPVVFPRSDSFLVRFYGEAVNPALAPQDPNYVTGRAVGEAVVQRLPVYFDSSQSEETLPTSLNSINGLAGRRFKIISIRWLPSSEI